MKKFAERFYKSKAWKNCRDTYAKSVHHLCERCMERGEYTPGEIVHHKIHVTPENINNPDIVLNFEHLELLCRKCHAKEHEEQYEKVRAAFKRLHQKRYVILPDGSVKENVEYGGEEQNNKNSGGKG